MNKKSSAGMCFPHLPNLCWVQTAGKGALMNGTLKYYKIDVPERWKGRSSPCICVVVTHCVCQTKSGPLALTIGTTQNLFINITGPATYRSL
jgi:hypothetical protein